MSFTESTLRCCLIVRLSLIHIWENSRMVTPELNATAAERVKGMVALRDCVNELIALQMAEYSACLLYTSRCV